MGLVRSLQDAWRKNEPELRGLFDGALPDFVKAARPREVLGGVPVFCYHLVDAEEFEADLAHLARNGYDTVRGQELLEYLRGERTLPGKPVLLTFDDGPVNFFQVAFPLLRRFEAKAIAFIAPALHAEAAVEEESEARPMTWEELGSIHASGLVEFQSHTLESRFVPEWPRPAALSGVRWSIESRRRGLPLALREDLERSRRMIETRLPGTHVNQLAFPMYLGTSRAIEDAQAAGLEACYWGLQAGRALNRPGDSPFHISRMSDEFLRRLPGSGRLSLRALAQLRMKRIRAAREWRRAHPG